MSPGPSCRTGVTWDGQPRVASSTRKGIVMVAATQPQQQHQVSSGGAGRRSGATALPLSPGPPPPAKGMLSLPPVQKLLQQLPAGPARWPRPPVGSDTAEVTSPVLATKAGQPACYSALQADELRPLANPKPVVATSTGPLLR